MKGNYNMPIGSSPRIVATFSDKTFFPSSGASGNYEVSGDTVILSGMSIAGRYKIDDNKLVGDRFTFVPCDPNDKAPINLGPRGFDHETGTSSTLGSRKN